MKLKINKQTNSVSKNIIVTLFCFVILKGLTIILSPILTRYLDPSEYSLVSNYNVWFSIAGSFIGLEVQGSISNALLDYKEKKYKYASNCISIGLVTSIIFAIPMIIFKEKISALLDINEMLVCLMIPHGFFMFCITFLTNFFSADRKPILNFLLSFTVSVVGSAISFTLLIGLGKGYFGYILGSVIANIVFGLIIVVYVSARGRSFFDWKIWKYALIIGVPLVFHRLVSEVLYSSDKIMIKNMLGDYEMGVYSFTRMLSNVLTIIWSAVNSGVVPFYFLNYEKKDDKEVQRITNSTNIFFTIMCVGFMMVFPEIYKLIYPSSYSESINIMGIMVLSVFFTSIYSYAANYEFYHKKTIWLATGTVITGVVNILLNIFFIKEFGMSGAIIATCVSYFLLFIVHEIIARFIIKEFPIKWHTYIYSIIVMLASVLVYYSFLNVWIIRWIIAVIAGTILIYRTVKNKRLF